MIHHSLLLIISLFFFMAMLFLLSQKIRISYPIFLVIGGLCISFVPQVPNITVNPDIVFLIFLPPLLFDAAWNTSWNSFWKWKRSIFLLGFGLVLFTSVGIAYFSAHIIAGFTLSLGFLLGGIISPPDAVAAASVLKGIKIPKRGVTILEGESLVNDAASLTIFTFAMATIKTGNFIPKDAIIDFFVLSVMGVFVGLVIAHILYFVLKSWAKSSSITTPITLIAPYLMYVVAEELHWSGVLAVVSGGLFLSFRSKDFLNYHTRLQTKEVWETVDFLLNGFVFILIGLELPVIINGLEGEYNIEEAIRYACYIAIIVIVLRILLVYLMEFVPRFLSENIRKREKSPGWKLPIIIGWSGMRGVVSLASALSIPIVLETGIAFPHRNLILFITFVVILVTLVFQGLTLPVIIKLLKVEEIDDYIPEEEQIEDIRYRIAQNSVAYLDKNYSDEMQKNETIARIKEQLLRSISATDRARKEIAGKEEVGSSRKLFKKVMMNLIEQRRAFLHKIANEKKYDDFIIRDMEDNLDLEEARLNKQ
ncbi:MAG: Na+/H+ antiporter [Arachidicoccus sp.]|nr:Na+/H+ antiporter [Arachidicoccus sp.]